LTERAVIFGRDAESYDRHRPEYPPEAIDHLVSLVEVTRAVEVGAGTGKATVGVAREGIELICVEPSVEMARLLAAKSLPGVEVVVSTLEDWEPAATGVDLVYAAQAWHWVDGDTAYAKVRSMLRPGGALALMWNIPTARFTQFEDVYRRHAPGLLDEADERIRKRDAHDWLEEMGSAGFSQLSLFTHSWSRRLVPGDFRSLCATYSDHMMLEDAVRERLLEALESEATARGVPVIVEYRTDVFSGTT